MRTEYCSILLLSAKKKSDPIKQTHFVGAISQTASRDTAKWIQILVDRSVGGLKYDQNSEGLVGHTFRRKLKKKHTKMTGTGHDVQPVLSASGVHDQSFLSVVLEVQP